MPLLNDSDTGKVFAVILGARGPLSAAQVASMAKVPPRETSIILWQLYHAKKVGRRNQAGCACGMARWVRL